MSEKFEFEYKAPSLEEKREIDSIRRSYLPPNPEESKIEEIKKLDNIVNSIPKIIALSLGIIGILLFGAGLTFFLEWTHIWYFGIPFIVISLIPIILAYPMHNLFYKKLRDKYGPKIIQLSNDLLENDN